jgi:hypothetical protein
VNTTPCTGNCNQGRDCTCMNQRNGGERISCGRPVAEMACYEPEPELSFWQRLWHFMSAERIEL